ncbi:MAG: endonuclease NucS domain-containing protein, partial [Puniceicoccales bacterium]
MAIQHGIWKIGEQPQKVAYARLESEELLEDQISKDIAILNDGWLLIGRQVLTGYNNYIDLLAVDADGSLIIIELKRHKTPREVVAQALDYASWVNRIDSAKISEIYAAFSAKYGLHAKILDEAFQAKFHSYLSSVDLNNSHQIVIVAAELDASTERIIQYLNDEHDVAVNAIFFRVFEDAGNRYLSRAWMIDPGETQDNAASSGEKEPWNGEFYVSFGEGERRHWGDAVRYGFISAGGGQWYSKTLSMLSEGDRIWVNCP